MSDLTGTMLAALAGVSLSALLLGLAASIPWVLCLAAIVLIRREGVPVIYNLRSLFKRRMTTAVTLVGLVLVTFVLTSALMLAGGMQRTMASTGSPLVLKVLQGGNPNETTSHISLEQAQLLSAAPEAAVDANGAPRVAAELVVPALVMRARTSESASLLVRGVSEMTFKVHAPPRVQGRMFAAGKDELVIGRSLMGRFKGAELGGTMTLAGRPWAVVGIADHGGTAHDSELWADFHQVSAAYRRTQTVVNVATKDAEALQALVARIEQDPTLNSLDTYRETTYWSGLSGRHVRFVTLLGILVASLFSFGAILGAMNTMYAQVAARSREVGTLRSLGFKPRAILTSLVLESALLALLSGAIGVAAAALLLDGVQFNLTTQEIQNEMAYGFHLAPLTALACLMFSCLMGYAGGLLPALRAARMPLVNAMRAD
jgi:ABC-type lipoprotein release transport system permease subunit